MTEIDTRAAAQQAAREHRAFVQTELRRIQLKLFEACEKVTDHVTAQFTHAPAATSPADVERRQVANVLGLWQFCARRACTRSRCCKGQPLHCLRTGITLLPEGTLEAFVRSKRKRRKR